MELGFVICMCYLQFAHGKEELRPVHLPLKTKPKVRYDRPVMIKYSAKFVGIKKKVRFSIFLCYYSLVNHT